MRPGSEVTTLAEVSADRRPVKLRRCLDCPALIKNHRNKTRCIPCAEERRVEKKRLAALAKRKERRR